MLQSIRSKVLLAILAVTMVTACSITVVFYFKSAGMIEENYSTNLYGRVKQTVTSLDDSLQEIYYINVKAAGDINMAQYIKEYRKSESGEALDKMKKEPLVAEVLGDVYVDAYRRAKEKEWTKYQSQITKWEIENYLYLL